MLKIKQSVINYLRIKSEVILKDDKLFLRLTKEKFIQKAKLVHGSKYDYTLVDYINNTTKVKIICQLSGSLRYTVKALLRKRIMTKEQRFESFILRAQAKYKDRFLYHIDNFSVMSGPMLITEKDTNIEFYQSPSNHLRGLPHSLKTEGDYKNLSLGGEAIERLKQWHPNIDFSNSVYEGALKKVTAICPIHGEFSKRFADFSETSGCPKCGRAARANAKVISLVNDIKAVLDNEAVEYEENYEVNGYTYAFYIKACNALIDCIITKDRHSSNSKNVKQGFLKTYQDIKKNHGYWKNATSNGYKYFGIYDIYWNLPEKKPIYTAKIRHLLGKDRIIYARKTIVKNVELSVAKDFMNINHLEAAGFTYKNTQCYGLYHKDTDELLMVAVVGMIYKQGSDGVFEPKLQRICTVLNTTVSGGISKLTKYINENTDYHNFSFQITLSTGGTSLSNVNGVRLIDPRYWWVHPKTLVFYPRNKCQKSVLEKNFGEPLLKDETEREYMERLGYLRLFDNGLASITFEDRYEA